MMEEAKAQALQTTPGTRQCAICLKMLLRAGDNQVKKSKKKKEDKKKK